jgi:hypothetical protein
LLQQLISKTHALIVVATTLMLFSVNIVIAQRQSSNPELHQPELMFDIDDEVMADPLGIINDVVVGADGVVYLLDEQNCNIRRITFSGELKTPLGRAGEGPGEFSRPLRLALFRDGRCLVIQNMSNRVVCLNQSGDACDMLDISLFRGDFSSIFVMRVETDPYQRLILATINFRHRGLRPDGTLEDLSKSASVKRTRTVDRQPEILISTEAAASDVKTISIPFVRVGHVVRGWDINEAGTIIYSDPGGSYGVYIGHPADGETISVDLPQWEYDEERIEKYVKETGNKTRADELSRIARVEWLDTEFFMVFPLAEVRTTPIANLVSTVEVFRRDGAGFGRFDIQCDFDPANDDVFIRGDVLVLIKGGKSVGRAIYSHAQPHEKAPEEGLVEDADEIRVVAYRLFRSLRAIE